MVSCTVATVFSAVSGISVSEAWVLEGLRSIRALDVFFCLRPHDCDPLLRIAEFSDDSKVSLQRMMRTHGTGE